MSAPLQKLWTKLSNKKSSELPTCFVCIRANMAFCMQICVLMAIEKLYAGNNIMLMRPPKNESCKWPESWAKITVSTEKNCEERELRAESWAFGTEIREESANRRNLGPVRPGKWKSGKTGNPKI